MASCATVANRRQPLFRKPGERVANPLQVANLPHNSVQSVCGIPLILRNPMQKRDYAVPVVLLDLFGERRSARLVPTFAERLSGRKVAEPAVGISKEKGIPEGRF